ncbi:hypothetical protein SmJEL517_g03057 [Synchytrium microbalum]|uniref:Vacuolar fusion protein MON1 n=1 Tax=Synchytrium microbalum TaxID=1806994 RepID=A0A507BXZ5_9FUNG|nr:uncharacterized protein SmJEL517_g03057 [Synchytrium microbalum]TPX34190.1 hypothetical protein SmJEL517_g03057 [Synchytrium microbalum]
MSSAGTLKNFVVLHTKTAKIHFTKNFQGDALDQSLLVAFSSTISTLCNSLLGEGIREIVSVNGRLVYREFGSFVFIAHCDLQTSSAVAQAVLRDIGGICELLFGSCEFWEEDYFDLNGAQDVVGMFFKRTSPDPASIVGGTEQVFLEPEVCERLDKLLAYLESQNGVCGSGTMLILGDSVLYSRFGLQETRMILKYHKARPLGTTSVRFTPVFCYNSWRNLYTVRIGNYVLVVLTYIDKAFAPLERKIAQFRIAFTQSRLEIPIEEPPILLRMYAKRETLAMLYHNIKTGTSIFPQLRPGPEVQQKEIMNSFWTFFSEAVSNLSVAGVTEWSISRDQYRFYARSEGIHKLYVLFTAESMSAPSANVASEILQSILQHRQLH